MGSASVVWTAVKVVAALAAQYDSRKRCGRRRH